MILLLFDNRELCAIHKPGEVAVTASVILRATQMATDRAQSLHERLHDALTQLETEVAEQRAQRLEKLRAVRSAAFSGSAQQQGGASSGSSSSSAAVIAGAGGIDRDDPMLAWASLHQAAGLREIE